MLYKLFLALASVFTQMIVCLQLAEDINFNKVSNKPSSPAKPTSDPAGGTMNKKVLKLQHSLLHNLLGEKLCFLSFQPHLPGDLSIPLYKQGDLLALSVKCSQSEVQVSRQLGKSGT